MGEAIWSGGELVSQTTGFEGLSLADARALKKRAATEEYRGRIVAGVVVGGVRIETGDNAQGQLDRLVARLTSAGGTQSFVTVSGAAMTVNLAQAAAIRGAVEAYAVACLNREAALYAAIDAAETVAAVAAIDITTGWPGEA